MNANFNRAMRQYEEMRTAPPPMPQIPQHRQSLHSPWHEHLLNLSTDSYGPPAPAYGQAPEPGYAQQPQQYQQHPPQQPYPVQDPHQQHHAPAAAPEYQATQFPQANPAHPPQSHPSESVPGQPFYAQHQNPSRPGIDRVPSGAPSFPPNEPHRQGTEPGAAGMGAADQSNEHAAAWEAYYRQQAEQQQAQPHGAEYGASPYPPVDQQQQQGQRQASYGSAPPGHGQGSVDSVAGQMGRMSVHGQ